MNLRRRPFSSILLAAGFLIVPLVAQGGEETTVEGRLLGILRERGVITEGEYGELRALEVELRKDSDTAAALDARVDAMVARLAEETPRVGYKIGKGFNFESADKKFALTIGGRIQVRFTHTEYDDDVSGSKFDEGEPNFDVPRTRLWFEGHAFESYWRYNVQFDVAGDTARGPFSGSGGNPAVTSTGNFTSQNRLTELKDAYVEFTKWKPFNLRAGQFKIPYSRQQITSSGRQQFVDRAITDRIFAPGRDHGLMIFGSLGGEKDDVFEYYVGAFDGEGENFVNNDDGLFYVGRMVVNPMGGLPYSEADLGGTESFKLALGVNAFYHDNDNHNQAGARFDTWSVGLDLTAAWQGFWFTGEVHYREDEAAAADVEIFGWFAQLGYFLVPHEFEIGIRAANIDWDNPASATAQREYLGLLGWYFAEHNLKIQADFGRVELHTTNQNNDDDEWRLRLQAQLVF